MKINAWRRRLHLVVAAVSLLTTFSTNAAQTNSTSPVTAWDGLRIQMESACVRGRTSAMAAARGTSQQAIGAACGCLARETAEKMRTSPRINLALREGQRQEIPQIIAELQTEPDGRHLFDRCMDQAEQSHGPARAAAVPGNSTSVGLTGPIRKAFIAQGKAGCLASFGAQVASGRISEQELHGYCDCMAEGVADRVSESHLQEGLAGGGRSPTLDAAGKSMQGVCSQMAITKR